MSKPSIPYLSVVVPVYNEKSNLEKLHARLQQALCQLHRPYEIIYTNDGSTDNSQRLLNDIYTADPSHVRVIEFNGNFGQHMAIMAAFEHCRGEVIVTLDADLQNPPEEIHKLLAAIDSGHDVVGGYRKDRKDTKFRRYASLLNNKIRTRITKIKMTDQGCMLRAYKRHIVDLMVASKEASAFIPALAYNFASNPTEIEVEHDSRNAGESKYKIYDLLRLNFNIMTSFSLIPLQIFTFIGLSISIFSTLFFCFLMARRLIVGPEADGLFTLFAILFFLVGISFMGLGIMGEYIGRIYEEVRHRPRFVIKKVYQDGEDIDKELKKKVNMINTITSCKTLIFAYSEVGYRCLKTLINRKENIIAVFTHQDNPKEKIWFQSVKTLASQYNIPVFTPVDPNAESVIKQIQQLEPDLILSFYYRQMLSMDILETAKLGAFNMHGSLLPKYRGRTPTNWALVNGEQQSGATLHHMTVKPDAGDIVDQQAVTIAFEDTALDLNFKVAEAATQVLARQFEALKTGTAPQQAQDQSQASYFGGRKPADGKIDWQKSTVEIYNLIRAVTHPYPGAFTELAGKQFFIWSAKVSSQHFSAKPGTIISLDPLIINTADGSLEVTRFQWQNGKEQTIANKNDFLFFNPENVHELS